MNNSNSSGPLQKPSKRERSMFRFRPNKIVKLLQISNGSRGAGPRPRSGHRIVIFNGSIYSFGGYNPVNEDHEIVLDDVLFKELWRFNYASKVWECLDIIGSIPEEVASHCAVSVEKYLLVFGGTGVPFGHTSSNSSHLCDLQTSTWYTPETSGTPPLEMYGQAMTVSDNKMYVVGGTTGYIYSISVHCLDLITKKWKLLSNNISWEPPPRYRHEIAIVDNQLFVFGGGTADESFDLKEIPVFNVETCCWSIVQTSAECPEPRKCHGLVQIGSDVYICGGFDGVNIFDDIWKINLKSLQWTKLPVSLPIPVYFHSVAVSEVGQLFVFGGVTSIHPNQRTDAIFSMWLKIPSLFDISWDAVLHYMPFIGQLRKDELFEAGIPIRYLNQIKFQELFPRCCNRLQS